MPGYPLKFFFSHYRFVCSDPLNSSELSFIFIPLPLWFSWTLFFYCSGSARSEKSLLLLFFSSDLIGFENDRRTSPPLPNRSQTLFFLFFLPPSPFPPTLGWQMSPSLCLFYSALTDQGHSSAAPVKLCRASSINRFRLGRLAGERNSFFFPLRLLIRNRSFTMAGFPSYPFSL